MTTIRLPVCGTIMGAADGCKAGHARLQKYRRRLRCLAMLILGSGGILSPTFSPAQTTNYFVRGVVMGVNQAEQRLIIAHEKVPNLMDAMTMPFKVKDPSILTNAPTGSHITFELHLTETESWVDHIEPSGVPVFAAGSLPVLAVRDPHPDAATNSTEAYHSRNPLRTYKFTNELGQPVSLSDFPGQAIALTFFFTRCPLPDFCPRLSRNFEQVQHKLKAMDNCPTNWHLLSISFDPDHDTPEVLKAYGESYQYDPSHWSFLTGPKDKVTELARLCDVKFEATNGSFNHNFRTLIIDASNHLQMVFPTSGDLSDPIVQELLKATGGTNRVTDSSVNYAHARPDNK
jgi:protein SCO1/2